MATTIKTDDQFITQLDHIKEGKEVKYKLVPGGFRGGNKGAVGLVVEKSELDKLAKSLGKKVKEMTDKDFLKLKRKYAVKIHEQLDETTVKYIKKELNAFRENINHSNIVRMFNYGSIDGQDDFDEAVGRPYLVMEAGEIDLESIIRGRSHIEESLPVVSEELEQVLDKVYDGNNLKDDFVFGSIENILEGLKFLENQGDKGNIHRDIKPSNIILFLDGDKVVCKIADFEEMKALGDTVSATAGTVTHMAPEQMRKYSGDDKPGFAADMFPVGLMLYQLLTRVGGLAAPSLERKTKKKLLEKLDFIDKRYEEADPTNEDQTMRDLVKEQLRESDPICRILIDEKVTREDLKKKWSYIDFKEIPELLHLHLDLDNRVKNVFLNRIIRKATIFNKDKPGKRTEGRYQTAEEFLADIRVAKRYKEYDAIEEALSTDLSSDGVVEDRRRAKDKWRKTFIDLFGFESDGDYTNRRRGQNWLLDKFEDEVIAKRVDEDRESIEEEYNTALSEVASKKGKADRLKTAQRLSNYARIWKSHEDLMKGYKGDVRVHASKITAKNIEDLATDYDPEKKVKQLNDTKIKNEEDVKDLEEELQQYEELLGAEDAFKEKRKEITTYRKKVEEACERAKKTYDQQQTPRKFNPDALKNALKVLGNPQEYGDKGQFNIQGFYQVDAAKVELIHTDRILRKWYGAGDSEEEVDDVFHVPSFMMGRQWAFDANVAAMLSKLAEHRKIGMDDYKRAGEGTLDIPGGQEEAFASVRLLVRAHRPGATKEDIYAAMKEYVKVTGEEKDRGLLDKFERENKLGKYAPKPGDFFGE